MGRSASHITLECYLQTRCNYVLVSEEIQEKRKSLMQVTQELADVIVERSRRGKDYGIVLVPEGAIEFFPEIKVLISHINDLCA